MSRLSRTHAPNRCTTGRLCSCCRAGVRSAPIMRASIMRCMSMASNRTGSSPLIGAINASQIAGNPRHSRLDALKAFWQRMAYKPPFGVPAWTGLPDTLAYWQTLLRGIPDFFKPNTGAFLGTHVPLGEDHAGFYSTKPLEQVLRELVDFDLVNTCKPRLTVGPRMCERR